MHVTADGEWLIHESPGEPGLVRNSTLSGERDPDWRIRTEGNSYAISDGPLGVLLVGGEFPTVGGYPGVSRWGLAAYSEDVIFIDGFWGPIYARPAPPPLAIPQIRASPPLY
jgi:hypothetical protein